MAKLGEIVHKVRSKNAGPFWLTLDIFCEDDARFDRVCASFDAARIARLFSVPEAGIKSFLLPDLHVLKFSLPRPAVQGSIADRDMHGASWAALLAEEEL